MKLWRSNFWIKNVFLYLCKNKTGNTMNAATKKTATTTKTTGLSGAVKTEKKKKLTPYEREKAIQEISQSINRNMTRRYLMDFALGRK